MPISNYKTGFPNGVTIRNVPVLDIQNSNGNVFWVDSNSGSNENKGTFTFPFASLKYAITRVKEAQGDKIFVAAGHIETITNGTDYDISTSGIQIIGMGTNENAPIFYFTTLTTATLTLSGHDIYIGNIVFNNQMADLEKMISITNYGCEIENSKLLSAVSIINIMEVDAIDNSFVNDSFYVLAGETGESAIKLVGQTLNTQLINCYVVGDFSEGCFYVPLATGQTDHTIIDGGEFVNTSTTAYPFNILGTDSTGIISKSVSIRSSNPEKLDVFNDNGAKFGQGAKGDVISFSTIIPVSKIESSSAYLFNVRSGSFMVENVIWETDDTLLGGSTNVIVNKYLGNYGTRDFFEEAVANLPARTTVELKDASITSTRVALQEGDNLRVNKTGATLTGANNLITFSLRLLEDGSVIVKNPSY